MQKYGVPHETFAFAKVVWPIEPREKGRGTVFCVVIVGGGSILWGRPTLGKVVVTISLKILGLCDIVEHRCVKF